ncbi:MAG: Rid family detoxifying hydrolase [Dehalococcoidales bacterium]|nr:Rid family detoxifying hydrolase [Dehalococcoidales bacterium]
MKNAISTDKAPTALGAYSQGIRAGDFLFVSGQLPLNPETGKVEGTTIGEQTARTLENLKAILKASGASLKDVVKVTVILSDTADFKPMNEMYKSYFSEPFPARVAYGGKLALPSLLVEIDAIAYVGQS